jgi:phenolic acid decarboxylase
LEGQVLHYRKLHADALQMLVSMGRILLANQQTLLNVIAEVRDKYELFSNFIVESSSQLSIVNPEAIVDPDE